MKIKPRVWYPIALLLTAANVLAAAFAAGSAEPWHATIHAALGLGFGAWSQYLRLRAGAGEGQVRLASVEVLEALGGLEADVSGLRQELIEAQNRLDFVERLLAKEPDSRRLGADRERPL